MDNRQRCGKGTKMKKIIAALILAGLSFSSFAQSNGNAEWEELVKTDKLSYQYLKGSLAFQHDQNNELFWSVQFRMVSTDNNHSIEFKRMAVSTKDCIRRQGIILFINTQNETDGKADFLFGGGTNASVIAETICIAADMYIHAQQEKNKTTPSAHKIST